MAHLALQLERAGVLFMAKRDRLHRSIGRPECHGRQDQDEDLHTFPARAGSITHREARTPGEAMGIAAFGDPPAMAGTAASV
jgi:hypothetical protein